MADNQNDTKNFEERIQELGAKRNWDKKEIEDKIAHLQNLKTSEAMEEYLDKLEQEDEQQPNNDSREGDNQSKGEEDAIDVDEGKKDDAQQQEQANGQEEEGKIQVPTDEFKEFIDNTYGEGAFDKHYEHGPEEEKTRFEEQYRAVTGQEPLRDAKVADFSENPDEQEKANEKQEESDWKEMRRQAWKEYAKENDQPFEEISKAEDADLSMKVGDTPIHYQDKSHLTMGNGEYEKFVKAVQIEKAAKTDIINFGNIQSEEYKAKLAAACIQEGMRMKNGPKSIDLNLECFKNLDDATKAKIEEYNRTQAAKEAAKTQEKPQQSQQEGQQATENQGEQKPVENQGEQKPVENQGEQKPVKKDYKQMFDDKVAELKAEKEKNPEFRLDMSQYKSIDERIIAFAATKEAHVAIDNLKNDESLIGKDTLLTKEAAETLKTVKESLPEQAQKDVDMHEKKVSKFKEIKGKIQSGEMKRGQYRDENGNIKDARLTRHNEKGEKIQDIARNEAVYTMEGEKGNKKKKYQYDKNNMYKLWKNNNNSR